MIYIYTLTRISENSVSLYIGPVSCGEYTRFSVQVYIRGMILNPDYTDQCYFLKSSGGSVRGYPDQYRQILRDMVRVLADG